MSPRHRESSLEFIAADKLNDQLSHILQSRLGPLAQQREVWSGCMRCLLDYSEEPNKLQVQEQYLERILNTPVKRKSSLITLRDVLHQGNVDAPKAKVVALSILERVEKIVP